MKTGTCLVEVRRGDTVESIHRVHVAIVEAGKGLIASAGNPAHYSFVRSAIKMFQVLPFVESGGVEQLGFTTAELALCTASHGGEPFHVAAAQSMLKKAKLTEDALACGPHPPMHAPSAEALRCAGLAPTRIHHNCSGKHAGMLAFTCQEGWVTSGYHRATHPTQQRILSTVARWMRAEGKEIEQAIDGCGLPTFALPLDSVAEGCALFAAAVHDKSPAPSQIFNAMTAHPEMVAGTDRLDTDLMRTARGRLFSKVGAEGFYAAAIPERRIGIALKVEDGSGRASEPALLAVLRALNAIDDGEFKALGRYSLPVILNTRGETVGFIRTQLEM